MMRSAPTFAVPLTGLALILCPVAQADPNWTPDDWNYTKYLASAGVNYQGRVTTNEMIAKAHSMCDALQNDPSPTNATYVSARDALAKQGVLTQDEVRQVSYIAVAIYCPQFNNLAH